MSALDDIRQRAEAATEGPLAVVTAPNPYFACVNDSRHENIMSTWNHTPVLGIKDAEFFAHASTDVPRLLAALDAVLAEADDWEKRFQTTNTFDVAMRAAAHKIRAAVNNALEGGTMSNWPPPLASRAIRRHCPHRQVKGGYCAECGTQLNDALEAGK